MPHEPDAFYEFAAEFADGERWRLLQSQGRDDFEERLAQVVGDLPVRRRQALMMLLLALVEQIVTPPDVRRWLDQHGELSDEEIEELIKWLRSRRPPAE